MNLLKSMAVAFSTYSKIPMPQFEWNEKNMRYSMCFFPLIGVVIGAIDFLLAFLMARLGLGRLFQSVVLAVVPVLVTGGIHMDGFLDTVDAMSSWRTKEERLSILKDPHVGAFAVIFSGVLWVLVTGSFSEILAAGGTGTACGRRALMAVAAGFVISRCLSGISVIIFPKAKKNGILRTMSDAAAAARKRVLRVLIAELGAAAVFTILAAGWRGLGVCLAAGAVFVYYRHRAVRFFGGTTGDLAGWFLTVCEAAELLTAAVLFTVGH